MHAEWLRPDWPAPSRVRAVSTTRQGGVSTGVFASLNLGAHVSDDPPAVAENRRRIASMLKLRHEPNWLQQVHGKRVAPLDGKPVLDPADAAVTVAADEACVIMTADCLPVLFCDREGTRVAAAHAGWRGLAAGVLEATIEEMGVAPGEILAWFGPAIGPKVYEVGDEVREALVADAPERRLHSCLAEHRGNGGVTYINSRASGWKGRASVLYMEAGFALIAIRSDSSRSVVMANVGAWRH